MNSGLIAYLENSRINIRDTLNGGRTEATKTWYRAKQEYLIRHVYVIS
jgi:hypothetical protein